VRDLTAQVRQAVVAWLNDAAAATRALLVEERAYGPASPDKPVWPFVRVDLPVVVPMPGSCGDGGEYTFRVHGFAKGPDERATSAIANAIVKDLDGFEVDLPGVADAKLADTLWTGTQHLRDTVEADGWHAAVTITCRVDG
jgi:hypothetical protein